MPGRKHSDNLINANCQHPSTFSINVNTMMIGNKTNIEIIYFTHIEIYMEKVQFVQKVTFEPLMDLKQNH